MATVLLADDDRQLLRAFQTVLETEGFRVLTAPDGETAMAIVTAEHPDIVVTDYMMPKVDGVELCRRLRANRATAGIPVVVITAAFTVPRDGWSALLTKPVGIADLLSAIRSLLSGAPSITAQKSRNDA
ncbi:response regulator [Paraburkholderia oxyphila]|uniref:response regulator n=1 Tax=Paraburkholderia oxyphila TaxID=614212 RepID=UPI0004881B83|nr:response regulator [Paraburkholderia oxyphila]